MDGLVIIVWLSLVLFFICFFFRFSSPSSLSQTPRKSGQLKTKGLYGFVRHPMYSGLILTGLGVCLIVPSAARWICFGLLVIVLEKKMNFEAREERLGISHVLVLLIPLVLFCSRNRTRSSSKDLEVNI